MSFLARRPRRAKGSAILVSVALHGLFFLVLIATASGALLTGGAVVGTAGDSEVVPVSLAGMARDGGAQSTPEQQLQALLTRLRTDNSDIVVEPPKTPAKPVTSLDRLFDELDQAHGIKRGVSGSGGHGNADKGGNGVGQAGSTDADESRKTDSNKAKPSDVSGKALSSGGLWGQIEPCWSKLPDRSTVQVTLEIALSSKGEIATPPKIIRPSDEAPSEMRLIAEARALEAVSACVPYHGADLASAGRVYRVEFSRSR